MEKDIHFLGKIISYKKEEIAKSIHEDRMAGIPLTEAQQREFRLIEPTIMDLRISFITLFADALMQYPDKETASTLTQQWGEHNGAYFFHLGAPMNEALKDTTYYREYLWRAIKEEVQKRELQANTIFELIGIIDPLLDKAVYFFSLTYVEKYQQSLNSARSDLLKLSVPVVPIVPGVGVLPLIGNIDEERAQMLMEETLIQAGQLKLTHLVIDLSGVLVVDTMVADQLFKVIEALALLGVKTVFTGIRPEVAQTMITLGLRTDHLTVKANLHQALRELQVMNN